MIRLAAAVIGALWIVGHCAPSTPPPPYALPKNVHLAEDSGLSTLLIPRVPKDYP